MLLKGTIRTFVLVGILLYAFLFCYCQNSISYYNFVNVVVFFAYGMLLMWSVGREETYYTYSRLGLCVFTYSLLVVCLYMDLSFYYTNNSFFWDYTDPYMYFLMDERLLNHEIAFFDIPSFITSTYGWGFADWGANMSQMLFLQLIPSRYFYFFMQTVVGTIGALMLFDICGKIMKKEHAFIASLSYSIASFSVFYHCSFRKEHIMVFVIISGYWLFYKYLSNKKIIYLLLALFVSLFVLLFRPVVTILIWVAFFSYFVANGWGSSKMIPTLFALFIISSLAFSFIYDSIDHYTAGGDVTQNENYAHATTFSIMVSSIGVLIGPFPQLLFLKNLVASQIPLYGSGLLFKFFLFVFFWRGFVASIKNRVSTVLPLYVYCILEMVALAVVNDGLELRKAMPHISIFYIAAFWYISKYDSEVEADDSKPYIIPYVQTKHVWFITACFVFVASIFWNTR